MALGSFCAGGYAATHGGSALGLLHRPATIRRSFAVEPITVDLYGDSEIDGVYRGGNAFALLVFAEWTSALRTLLNPYGADFGAMGLNGVLESDKAASLVLTPQALTPAATLGTNTFTASKAIVAAQNNVEFLLGNVHRNIPVLLKLLPYDSSGTIRWFSVA